MAKVILLSTFPLPYSKIGSWTTIYKNYITQGHHEIDHIVCHEPQQRFENVSYSIVSNDLLTKIRRKIKFYKIGYIDALERILKPGEKYIIQLVDSFSIARQIDEMLRYKGMREDCYIQVFYHGFYPFLPFNEHEFYSVIDELVLLTHDSYRAHLRFYSALACRVSVLHNGIDTTRFTAVDAQTRLALKEKAGFEGKTVFLWLSVDRPKKGLGLLLDAWKRVYAKRQDIVLMVVGAKRQTKYDGVVFYGKIPNTDLPEYYQTADCFLFPTLCQEGFPLSLTEAINCGCHCIASALGGVPEAMRYGELGTLVQDPNFIGKWENAIHEYLNVSPRPTPSGLPVYPFETWRKGMNSIIRNAKISLER